MNKITTSTAIPTRALKIEALSNIVASFESFCLASGLEALREMMDHDVQAICGPRHARAWPVVGWAQQAAASCPKEYGCVPLPDRGNPLICSSQVMASLP